MLEIILGIGVAAFIVYASFSIVSLISLRRTSVTLDGFIKRTEGNINATLVELKGTLEKVRKITGDVGAVTEEVRQISGAVASLDKGLRDLYGSLWENIGPAAEANIAGLKAGIKTGVLTLVKNLQTVKEGSP
ncbi:MAG TPA: DUF948 domain-containing protein [Nitrospirota bacterium]|nr:DUF948 domain-containing protein [Nitrospirota bacterium]